MSKTESVALEKMKQFLGQSGSFCIDAFNATAVTGAGLSAAR